MQIPFEDDLLLGGIQVLCTMYTGQSSPHSLDCHIFHFADILLIHRDRIEILADTVTPPPLGGRAATVAVLEWLQFLRDVFKIGVAPPLYPPVDLRVFGVRPLLLS